MGENGRVCTYLGQAGGYGREAALVPELLLLRLGNDGARVGALLGVEARQVGARGQLALDLGDGGRGGSGEGGRGAQRGDERDETGDLHDA